MKKDFPAVRRQISEGVKEHHVFDEGRMHP
jgi:hypothetical protein